LNNRLPQRQAGHLTQQYLRNQIYSMSPLQLVIKIYDLAIQGCKMENSNKVSKAIIELISALRFEEGESGEIAVGLFRLYQYCLDCVKKNQFEETQHILHRLRETWIEIEKQTYDPKPNTI